MSSLSSILELQDYPMIFALQEEFTRVKGSFNLENQAASLGSFNIFLSEFKELVKAVHEKDYIELRDGIGDVITTSLALAYLIDMQIKEKHLKDIYFKETIFPREDYLGYVDDIYDGVLLLEKAIVEKDLTQVKSQIIRILAHTYHGLPEFAKFTIRDDLVAITASSLSKICPTIDDAEKSVEVYAKKGCETYFKKTNNGYAIFSSKEQFFNGETISKDKFLKFYNWSAPVFDEITDEKTVWQCYPNVKFKALALLENRAA